MGQDALVEELNVREARFVDYYLTLNNGSEAAIAAGYSKDTAGATASRLLKRPSVAAEIERRRRIEAAETADLRKRVIREFAALGFSDIRSVAMWGPAIDVTAQGIKARNGMTLKNSEDLPPEVARAVSEVVVNKDGTMRVKMHDKNAALTALARHLGMFPNKVEHSGPGGGPVELVAVDREEYARVRAAMIAADDC